jgi:hypothetical protein
VRLIASEEGRLVTVRPGLVHAQIRARPQVGGLDDVDDERRHALA